MSVRGASVLVAGALTFCLLAGSTPRIVGDGGEYLAQAMNFAMGNGPALGRRAIQRIEPRIHELSPDLADWEIAGATVEASDNRRDFLHFWFYAALATPALWVVDAIGISPIHAFTATNLALFLAAISVVVPRYGAWTALLVFGSPLVWWLDKPHTEVFTVSTLALALALVRDRPAIALMAAGAAATQNLPVIVVFVLIGVVQLWGSRLAFARDATWLTGAAAGTALALLHPVYTWLRHDTPSLLLYATRQGTPTTVELAAAVLDPTLGLLGNAPFLLAAIVAAVVVTARRPRVALADPAVVVACVSMPVFLYAFAQTSNTHHGATPSLTRYALWLLPLMLPMLAAASRIGGAAWRLAASVLAVLSCSTSVVAFHPNVPQNSREPTALARYLWTSWPQIQNPLPEVFSETLLGVEGTTVPAATDDCAKALIAPGDPAVGTWPVPCYPAELPELCSGREVLCYANRVGVSYQFARAPGRERLPNHDPSLAWPVDAEQHVRRVFDRWGWWSLADSPATVTVVRGGEDIQSATVGSNDRFLMVIRRRGATPLVRTRPAASTLSGELVDAITGQQLQVLAFTGQPGDSWTIPLPADRTLMILALTTGAPPP